MYAKASFCLSTIGIGKFTRRIAVAHLILNALHDDIRERIRDGKDVQCAKLLLASLDRFRWVKISWVISLTYGNPVLD